MTKEPHMSKRTEMFKRIMDAMPEDAEVQEYCAKEIERAGRSASKTAKRLNAAIEAIKMCAMEPVCAKDFAAKVNSVYDDERPWTTRTASYYLRQMVLRNIVEEVEYEDDKKGPKMYAYVGADNR